MFKCDQVGRQKAFMRREKATMVISERGPHGKEFFVDSVSDPSLCECLQIPCQSCARVSLASFSPSFFSHLLFYSWLIFPDCSGREHPSLCATNLVKAVGCSQTVGEWKIQKPSILLDISQLVFSNPQQSFVWMIRGWEGQTASQGHGRAVDSCVSKLTWQIRVVPCIIATCILT